MKQKNNNVEQKLERLISMRNEKKLDDFLKDRDYFFIKGLKDEIQGLENEDTLAEETRGKAKDILILLFKTLESKQPLIADGNSIPPQDILGLELAETNNEPTITTWEEFTSAANEDHEPWLIDGLLRPGWLAVLGGHGKHGKSTLAFHILTVFRRGAIFINPSQKKPVLYLNCEMAPGDVSDLIKATASSGAMQDEEKAFVINQPPLPLDLQWLEKALSAQEKPGVCVLDSFRAAFLLSGDTENQAGAVGGILRKLQIIARKTKWTIIVIHHLRKSGTGEPLDLAGSGEWLSAPDVIFTWHCPNPKEPGTFTAIGRIPPVEPFSLRLSREKIEFLGTVSQQTAEAERQRVLDALKEDEWQAPNDIADSVELPPGTTRRRLNELYEGNQAERQGEGKKGNPHLWKKKQASDDSEIDSATKISRDTTGGNESHPITKIIQDNLSEKETQGKSEWDQYIPKKPVKDYEDDELLAVRQFLNDYALDETLNIPNRDKYKLLFKEIEEEGIERELQNFSSPRKG
jgi:hypothetical protein